MSSKSVCLSEVGPALKGTETPLFTFKATAGELETLASHYIDRNLNAKRSEEWSDVEFSWARLGAVSQVVDITAEFHKSIDKALAGVEQLRGLKAIIETEYPENGCEALEDLVTSKLAEVEYLRASLERGF